MTFLLSQGRISTVPSNDLLVGIWGTGCPSTTGARPAGAKSQHCQYMSKSVSPHPVWFPCGGSLGICGRRQHHANVHCFHLPPFIFLLTTFAVSSFPPCEASLFHLRKVLGLSGSVSHLCEGEEMTQSAFQVRCPGFYYSAISRAREGASASFPTAPQAAIRLQLGPLTPCERAGSSRTSICALEAFLLIGQSTTTMASGVWRHPLGQAPCTSQSHAHRLRRIPALFPFLRQRDGQQSLALHLHATLPPV